MDYQSSQTPLTGTAVEEKETQSHVEAQYPREAVPQFDEQKIAWIRLKTDLCMLPFLWLMFFWNQVDRINIGNARVYALEAELGMSGYNFNTCLSLYFVSYLIFEIPLTIACKYYGPRYCLPTATMLFGVVSFATAYVHSFAGLAGIRFCLGIAEACIYPGTVYALTLFYTKRELVFRTGILVSGALFAGAFGGLIAYGVVNNIAELAGLRTWRMLFFIEGIVTVVAGIMCFIGYRDRPESAWFLTREEKELRKEYLAYHASLGLVAVDNTTKWSIVKQGIFNINTLLIGTIALLNSIIFQGIVVFLPTIISALYPTDRPVIKNLRSVPPYLAALVVMLIVTYTSTRIGGYRGFFGLCALGPFHVIGYALFLGASYAGGKYAGAFFILAGTNIAAICQAWIAANVAPDAGRVAGIAGVTVLQNVGGLISTWTYLPSAAPKFTAGNSINLGFGVTITLLFGVTLLYQRYENRLRDQGKRDHRLRAKTEQEIAQLGHLDPNFRYSY